MITPPPPLISVPQFNTTSLVMYFWQCTNKSMTTESIVVLWLSPIFHLNYSVSVNRLVVVILLRFYSLCYDNRTYFNDVLNLLYNIQVMSYNQRVPHKLLIKQASL